MTSPGDDLQRVHAALTSPPSASTWRTLYASALAVHEADPARFEQEVAPLLRRVLDGWPDAARRVPADELHRLADGKPPTVMIEFARALIIAPGSLDGPLQQALTTSEALGHLRRLDLSCNLLNDDALIALLEAPLLSSVDTLTLESCGLTNASLPLFERLGPGERPLRALSLGNAAEWQLGDGELANSFGGRGLRQLTSARGLVALERLDLSGVQLGSAGVRRLMQGAASWSLRELILAHAALDDTAAEILLRAEHFPTIERLDLTGNWITEATLDLLLSLDHPCALRELDVSFTPMLDTAVEPLVERLASASHLPHIAEVRWGRSSTNPQRWINA